ncbi:MAG: hypothetical protein DRG78_10995 [Epsilonproteobacteria bacterium]|nr:MAG: hypothetical protein DRG78_10995 [Campylobacterota bacterium]
MTPNLFQTSEYRYLMKDHIEKTIEYLFTNNQEFAIACEVKYVNFKPELPLDIKNNFSDTVLFVLSGYSFETAKFENEYFCFNAGFGDENFEATVFVPILAIKQLFVGDHPIVMNLSSPVSKKVTSSKNSMEALMNNPKNKRLLKKKKL